MGAGKSAVGRVLAERMNRVFFDIDEAVEARSGMSISEIFASLGEAAFRLAEADEIDMATDRKGMVVATGGGAFASAENRRRIHGSGGVSVFLDPSWGVIRRRLDGESSQRPKWEDAAQARKLYKERLADYRRATIHIELDAAETPEAVADRIVSAIAEIACDF